MQQIITDTCKTIMRSALLQARAGSFKRLLSKLKRNDSSRVTIPGVSRKTIWNYFYHQWKIIRVAKLIWNEHWKISLLWTYLSLVFSENSSCICPCCVNFFWMSTNIVTDKLPIVLFILISIVFCSYFIFTLLIKVLLPEFGTPRTLTRKHLEPEG